ncbi:hypothetical protein QBC38DRAFT_454018 [Podospora fimiseda]|uniref:Uncharacterized protein n=1 Tax=Podospora fimiseda TaxID=252190 RepID=A0AAN7BSG4_9PEZI|nr:hypothetical protein QBC38DRAFT_454018 [Podospora fimiseda]
MALPASLRLLRLLPAITSAGSLQFAIDEHLIFGTWMDPSLRQHAKPPFQYGGHVEDSDGSGF